MQSKNIIGRLFKSVDHVVNSWLKADGSYTTKIMAPTKIIESFLERSASEKFVLATLALVGDVPGRTRLTAYLRQARCRLQINTVNRTTSIDTVLSRLRKVGLVDSTNTGTLRCASTIQAYAIRSSIKERTFARICEAVDVVDRVNFAIGPFYPVNTHNAQVMLRMALLRRRDIAEVHRCLSVLSGANCRTQTHPYIKLFAQPFDSEFFALLHAQAQEEVMTVLLHRFAIVSS